MNFQLIVNGISIGAVYALIAVGFALVFSVLKFSNFAHGGMISACAFIAYFFQASFEETPPLWLTILVTCVCGVVLALVVDTICFRRLRRNNSNVLYYFLASVVFAILIQQVLTVFYGTQMYAFPAVFKNPNFTIFGTTLSAMDMTILCVAVFLLLILLLIIGKTRFGLAIRAVAIDSRTGRLMGINSSAVIVLTFAVAGLLAGITGVLLGIKYSVYPALGPNMMLKGFIASVIGGLGSLGGAICAAILLGLVEIISIYFLGSEITPVILMGIMLVFLLVRPQGISGKFAQDKA